MCVYFKLSTVHFLVNARFIVPSASAHNLLGFSFELLDRQTVSDILTVFSSLSMKIVKLVTSPCIYIIYPYSE